MLVVQMFLVQLMANIPTAVLLAIYFACREKLRRTVCDRNEAAP